MVKTQIQLPSGLYQQVKRLAKAREWSMAELCRRGLEYMLATHPHAGEGLKDWAPPKPAKLGINKKIPVSEWRLLANESPTDRRASGKKQKK